MLGRNGNGKEEEEEEEEEEEKLIKYDLVQVFSLEQ